MKPCDLFASRDTLEEAVEYATQLANALPPEHRMPVNTAIWVVANTAIKLLAEHDLTNIQAYPHEEIVGKTFSKLTTFEAKRMLFTYAKKLSAYSFIRAMMADKELGKLFGQVGTCIYKAYGRDILEESVQHEIQAEVEAVLSRRGIKHG